MVEMKREKEMSIKLREELKRVEMERMKILERIKELQYEEEDNEIGKSDMSINL
jgi:hypothetical protein